MPLDPKAKEFLLKNIKKTIEDVQNQSFDCFRKMLPKIAYVAEMFPDPEWTKELNLASCSLIVIGAAAEGGIPKLSKEKQEELSKQYVAKLSDFYTAIEEESIAKTDTFLKEFASLFVEAFGL
jgi:hypothetical protein